VDPQGPFALLVSVLWQLTGEPSLTLATLWANHDSEGALDSDYICARLDQHALRRQSESPQGARAAARAAAMSMASSFVCPAPAGSVRVDPRWALNCTAVPPPAACLLLSDLDSLSRGACNGPISVTVQIGLEAQALRAAGPNWLVCTPLARSPSDGGYGSGRIR
jgi:hypothetical protein